MSVYPKVVMLHDRDHGDFWQLQQAAELDAPLSVSSYTDPKAKESVPNKRLTMLMQDTHSADYLFIHDELLNPLTELAQAAINQAFFSERLPQIILFDDSYRPGHDVLELLRVATPEVPR